MATRAAGALDRSTTGKTEPSQTHLRPGMIVPSGWLPPTGWSAVPQEGGTMEAWPTVREEDGLSKPDPEIRRKTLGLLDEATVAALPSKQFPDRRRPSRLLVNRRFRELFRTVQSWQDVPIYPGSDDDDELSGDGPQFRYAYD